MILTVTGASTEEEPAESEGQHDTGDWHQWSSQHKPCSRGIFYVVWAPVKKKKKWVLESPQSDPTPCIINSHINLTTPCSCFHHENRSLYPQAGARLTTSGIAEVSLGVCELSTNSPTEDGDPRLTGSGKEAEVKSCRTGAETSPRTKVGSPEHIRWPLPLHC